MRATSPTSRPPQPRQGHGKSRGTILSRQEEGREDGREGSCDSKLSKQTCAEEEKKRLWQNILKALLGDDWLIAPSPISGHRHRQQVHFIHLYDNIYIVLTVGAQVFCQIQQLNKTKRTRVIVWKVRLVYSQWTHGRKRK